MKEWSLGKPGGMTQGLSKMTSPSLNQSTVEAGGYDRFGKSLLLVNGAVLGLIALSSSFLDLAGYFGGIGPVAPFEGQPIVVGLFEAHCLAFILCVLVLVHRGDNAPRWNLTIGTMHLLFGSANLTFWPFFVETGTVPFGIAITTLHFVFFGLEAIAVVGRMRKAARTP